MKGHDAGLKGELTDGATSATFKVAAGALDVGKSVTIGGKEYTIAATEAQAKALIVAPNTGKSTFTIDGNSYDVDQDGKIYKTGDTNALNKDDLPGGTGATAAGVTDLQALIKAGSKVTAGGKEVTVIKDGDGDGIDDSDSSVITAAKAVTLMTNELTAANNIGATKTAATVNAGTYASATGVTFDITKGTAEVADKLNFNLHVGSDADMTNKINVNIETMNSSYLGIKGVNVSDDTGLAATYAVDAIADALQKVSDQRSSLGAVQNRLEHTIANLNNVVENTTSAESRIRDVDMAEEMVEYSKNNILAQAGQSMLAQANQATQGVLSLLG